MYRFLNIFILFLLLTFALILEGLTAYFAETLFYMRSSIPIMKQYYD